MHSALANSARALLTLFLLLLFSGSAQGQEASHPKPGPEQQRLAVLAGKWRYHGTEAETPFGLKGNFKGRTVNRLLANGFVLEMHSTEKAGDWLTLIWYDAATKSYLTKGFTPSGAIDRGRLTINGNVWVGEGELRDKNGKVWKTRDTTTFSPDGKSSTSRVEYSPDDGKTWLLWYSINNKKVGS